MSKKIYIAGSSASFSNLYSNDMGGVNEYATCGNASKIVYEYANNFSFTQWVKMTNLLGVLSGVMTYNDSVTPTNNGWMLVNQTGTWRFYINASTFIASDAPATAGVWVLIGCTFSSTRLMKMYINGTLQASTTVSPAISYNAVNHNILRLGNYGDIRFLNGKLAHPAIWNKELSAAEMASIVSHKMNDYRTLSFGANCTAAFKFNAGTADYPIWTDYIGGINATMQNQESADINTDIPT